MIEVKTDDLEYWVVMKFRLVDGQPQLYQSWTTWKGRQNKKKKKKKEQPKIDTSTKKEGDFEI